MKIVVVVKEVPDTYGVRALDRETGLVDRDAGDRVLDEVGERAMEFAVSLAEQNADSEVVVVTVGPESAVAVLRKALAIGAARAVHVLDDDLRGADMMLTAEVLAASIERVGFDLVVAGNLSTDGSGGVIPSMVAERLGVPQATALTSATIAEGEVRGERASEGGTMTVSAALPAVISVTERFPEARFPNFKGIMAAKKKPLETLTLGDLGVNADAVVPRSIMISVAEKPPRSAGEKVVDSGDGGSRLAEFLVQNGLV